MHCVAYLFIEPFLTSCVIQALGAVHDQVRQMVIRIQRVIGKTGHPINPDGENSESSTQASLFRWRDYFTEIMMRREHGLDGDFNTQSGGTNTPHEEDAGTEWGTATSGHTVTGKCVLAQTSLIRSIQSYSFKNDYVKVYEGFAVNHSHIWTSP